MEINNNTLFSIMDFANKCLTSKSENSDILKLFDGLQELIPFEGALLGFDSSHDLTLRSPKQVVTWNINNEWFSEYARKGFDKVDPVLLAARKSCQPIGWQDVYKQAPSKANHFVEQACDFGLQDGLTCSYLSNNEKSGASLLSLVTNSELITPEHHFTLDYILPHLHEVLNRPGAHCREKLDAPVLTDREKEVLNWVKEGKGSWDIGMILEISERTVKFHLSNVFSKLDVINRSQAVAKALQHSIIEL